MPDTDRPLNALSGIVSRASILVRGFSAMEIAKQIEAIPAYYDEVQFVEWLRGPQGYSDYDLWTQQPGNEGKTEEEYFEFLGLSEALQYAGIIEDLNEATAAVAAASEAVADAAAALAAANLSLYATLASPTFTGTVNISEAFQLGGDYSPAQITANQNDYAPAALSTASSLRLDLDAARSITGLTGGADGRYMKITNISAFVLTLKNEDAASTAANRFKFGVDRLLQPDRSIVLRYDATNSRWRDEVTLSKATAAQVRTGTDDNAFATAKALADSAGFVAADVSEVISNVWTPDMSRGYNRSYTLPANTTVGAPTNMVDGQVYSWKLKQDGTGSRVPTMNAIFEIENGATFSFSTAAGKFDIVHGQYHATENKIRCSLNKAP